MPPVDFIYGTAWKEDRTEACVTAALAAGFRAIDTANQRRHYFEEGVGHALAKSGIPRAELFLQTKFTHVDGQDHRLPYDPEAPMAEQVAQSFESSLRHLNTDYLDSYVLHGPSSFPGLGDEDLETWRAMEALQRAGKTRVLGVSNVNLGQIQQLCAQAEVQPAYVQNRCFARDGWDHAVRAFCRERGIVYQGFSLLTANVEHLRGRAFQEIVRRAGATPAQVVFNFARRVGMLPLTGTTSPDHMREDLAADEFALAPEEVARIETIAFAQ